jgi:hypothetical protein
MGGRGMAVLRPERTDFGGIAKESSVGELRMEQMIKKLNVYLFLSDVMIRCYFYWLNR